MGLGGDRLEMYHIGASDAPIWVERVKEMTERIRNLGPNPLNTVRQAKATQVSGEENDSSKKKTV